MNAMHSLSMARGVVAAAMCLTLPLAAQSRQSTNLPTWSLGATALAVIGEDGSPAAEFSHVRAAFRLRDGLLAVVNGGNSEIRIFDTGGKLLRTFGRIGAGPGEFRSIAWAGRAGDTAFVSDWNAQRISVVLLDRDAKLLESILVRAQGSRGRFSVSGRLANGEWLVTTSVSPGWGGPPGVHRLPGSAGLMAATASGEVRWLGEFPSAAIFVYNPTGDIKQAAVGPIAFSPWFQSVASGPFVWIGETNSDSLVRVDSRTGARTTVRLPLVRRSPSRAMIAAARQRELSISRDPRSRAWTEAKYSAAYLPRDLPLYESLLPGPNSEVWVRRYADPADSVDYLILDATGTAIARLRTPPGFRIHDVAVDYALGTHEDADGVETVRLYRLTRR